MIKVRRATEADRFSVFKLCVSMHRETDFSNITLNPQKCLDGIGQWIHYGLLLVAENDEGDLIGLFAAQMQAPWFSDEPVAAEDLFYVIPEYRGTRAGYLLFKGFMEWAKEQQASRRVKHIRASVATGIGPAAERLYEHFGLKRMGGTFSAHLKE